MGNIVCAKAPGGAAVPGLLRPGRDGWSAEDWRTLFGKRAGIPGSDGCLSRAEAEGMWRRTYARLREHAFDAGMRADEAFAIRAERLLARTDAARCTVTQPCAHHGDPTTDSMNIRPGIPRSSDHPLQQHPTGMI
jgi:hypothetical protein